MSACSFELQKTVNEGRRLPEENTEAFCFGRIQTVVLNYIHDPLTHLLCATYILYSRGLCAHACVSVSIPHMVAHGHELGPMMINVDLSLTVLSAG